MSARAVVAGFLGILVVLGGVRHTAAAERSIYDFPATWRDETGAQATLGQWRGHRMALTTFFTSCLRTCPFITIKTMRQLDDRLREQAEPTEFVLVTLDPKIDTPPVLAEYKAAQGITSPHWHLLTGSIDDTERLARRLGVAFMKPEQHIFHSFKIVVFDSGGHVEHVLDSDHDDVNDVRR